MLTRGAEYSLSRIRVSAPCFFLGCAADGGCCRFPVWWRDAVVLLQRWLTRSREEELAVVVFGLVAAVVRRREDGVVVVLQWWREAAAMVVREDGAAESWWSDFDVQWRCGEDGGAVLMVVDGDGAAGCVEEMVDLLAWRMRCGEGSWWWCAELRWLSETAARMEEDGGGCHG